MTRFVAALWRWTDSCAVQKGPDGSSRHAKNFGNLIRLGRHRCVISAF